MKALFYNFGRKKFILKETFKPRIKPDEILVEVKASALCGTDLYIINGPLTRKVYNKKEIILGHSFAGVIAEIGNQIKGFKVRDRVLVSNFVWCGKCQKCQEGKQNLCDNRYIFGMEAPGSHAEYIAVPQRAVFHLPREIDFAAGSLITDLLALDIHAFQKADIKFSDNILIFGTGPVGLVLGVLLKLHGAKTIFAIEPVKYRQNLANKLFNPEIILKKDLKKFKNHFDIVFETSGNVKALDNGIKILKRGGKLIMVGVQDKNLDLNSLKFISRELSLFGIFDFTIKDIKKGLKLLKQGKIKFDKVITHRFSLKDGEKAYKLLKARKAGRIILF